MPAVQVAELPAPGLFDLAWQERADFRQGLVDGAQGVLQQLPGASVYHIDLVIAEDLTHVQGRQEVLYTNQENAPLAEVVFRLFPNLSGGSLSASQVRVDGAAVDPVYEADDSVLRAPLSQPLQPGQQTVIEMAFDLSLPTDESSNYGTFAYLGDVLALASFYPVIAVYDEQGWDVEIPPPWGDILHADSSFYRVRVTAPKDLVVAASGVELQRQQPDPGQQTLTFAAGPARDFYLVASSRYQVASQQVGEVMIHSYSFPEAAGAAQQVLRYAAAALRSFEDRFGPYPYSELDLVATATSALGVEYPGIMAIAQRIYDDQNRVLLESTTAHEVAHQWFYNVVGNDQLDEPWLDEALAQYATLLYFQDAYGQQGYDGFRRSLLERWQRVDLAAIPVGLPVSDYEGQEYGAIVYGRAPLFLEALAAHIGQPAFDAFLQDYVRSNQWGIATTESFKQLAERHCQCDLTDLFDGWVVAK